MATRRLARTIVEGGRTNTYKSDVRATHRSERRAANYYCQTAKQDPEFAEGAPDLQAIVSTFKCEKFADRLAVLHRWLEANCDRPYDDVYADFRRSLDVRNLKDWHLAEHMQRMIDRDPFRFKGTHHWGFNVDADGILRYAPPSPRHRPVAPKSAWRPGVWVRDRQLQELFGLTLRRGDVPTTDVWTIDRLVIEFPRALYWAPLVRLTPDAFVGRCDLCADRGYRAYPRLCGHGVRRQGVALDGEATRIWNVLPEYIKVGLRVTTWK